LNVWAAVAVIIAAGAAAYSNSLHGPFVFDDLNSIPNNPRIRNLGRLDEILLPPKSAPYYRPTVTLSLALCYYVGVLDVLPYHVCNLGIHVLAALTLFGLVSRTLVLPRLAPHYAGAATLLALCVSLLWMLHPLQTQAVTYVIQRCESLMGLFCLLTLYCVLRGSGSARAWWWYGGAVVACALGMASKEVMVMVPALVMFYDRIFLTHSWREALGKRWGLYLALFLTSAILVPMIWVSRGVEVRGPVPTSWEYARTQAGIVLHYLRLSFWPDALCLDYRWPVAKSVWEIVPPAIVIVALLLATVWALYRSPGWGFLGGSFFLTLAPSSSFIPIPDLAFEHRMYLALAPLAGGVVLGGYETLRSLAKGRVIAPATARTVGVCLVAAASVALGSRTYLRNEDYRSDLRMWQDAAAKAPHNYRAHNNAGNRLFERGRLDEATVHFQKALVLNPASAEAHHSLGKVLAQQQRIDEAIVHYRIALNLNPKYAEAHGNLGNALVAQGKVEEAIAQFEAALRIKPHVAEAHNNLGNAYLAQERVAEAIARYRRSLELNPSFAQSHSNLGIALLRQNSVDAAIAHFRQALHLDPNYAEAHFNLGVALRQQGQEQLAIQHWRVAVRLQPHHIQMLRQLAWALATSTDASIRQGAEAVALAERAVQLAGAPSAALLDALAAAYAEAGRFTDAVQTAQEALQMLSGQQQSTPLADGLRERIRLYQAGSAFRESSPDTARERKVE
jgi:tetratricopeptide (TPR) repeat protein